jgi:hypothetical protein
VRIDPTLSRAPHGNAHSVPVPLRGISHRGRVAHPFAPSWGRGVGGAALRFRRVRRRNEASRCRRCSPGDGLSSGQEARCHRGRHANDGRRTAHSMRRASPPHRSRRHVQEHQDAVQLRPTRHGAGDTRRVTAVRPKAQWLRSPIEDQHRSLRSRCRRRGRRGTQAHRVPGHDRSTSRSRRRGFESKSPIVRAIRNSTVSTWVDEHARRPAPPDLRRRRGPRAPSPLVTSPCLPRHTR